MVDARPGLLAWNQLLDGLAADIKGLEAAFAAVRLKVVVPIAEGEEIAWEKAEPTRWRLMYRRRGVMHRPLIEAPVEARLRAKPFLPELVRKVAEAARAA